MGVQRRELRYPWNDSRGRNSDSFIATGKAPKPLARGSPLLRIVCLAKPGRRRDSQPNEQLLAESEMLPAPQHPKCECQATERGERRLQAYRSGGHAASGREIARRKRNQQRENRYGWREKAKLEIVAARQSDEAKPAREDRRQDATVHRESAALPDGVDDRPQGDASDHHPAPVKRRGEDLEVRESRGQVSSRNLYEERIRQPFAVVEPPEDQVRHAGDRDDQEPAGHAAAVSVLPRRADDPREGTNTYDEIGIGPCQEREAQRYGTPHSLRTVKFLAQKSPGAEGDEEHEERGLEPATHPCMQGFVEGRQDHRQPRPWPRPRSSQPHLSPYRDDDEQPEDDVVKKKVLLRPGSQAHVEGSNQHPQKVGVTLHREQPGIEHRTVAGDQIPGIAERDECVVEDEPVSRGLEPGEGEPRREAGHVDPTPVFQEAI